MKKIFFITMSAALLITASCKDNDFLDIDPRTVVPTDKMFSDPALVLSVVGDLYQRQVDFSGLDNGWASFVDFSEAFPSENGSSFFVQRTNWGFGEWNTWDYGYIRDINLFIERATASTELNAADKKRFIAEGRFLRAAYYFELVKRMGGVPLITTSLTYENDVVSLQQPRAKESEVYDFVISELTAIKNDLPSNSAVKSRASKGAAFAMMSRAALYAGSIAKYGALRTPSVTLAGNEVGIPASMATGYYQKALAAADSIIEKKAGSYGLYISLPNLSDNFAAIFTDKSVVNTESIYIEDFKVGTNKVHSFTVNNQPYSRSEEGADAGRLNPSLNIVQAFEKLDNTYAPIPTTNNAGQTLYYTNQQDIFAGRDARLAGTVMLPSSIFKGAAIDVRAGYQNAAGDFISTGTLPGTSTPAVGLDGPSDGLEFRTQTGFYIRKYLDPVTGSGRRGRRSELAFIRYRYAEVLLNAAEAAFELGDAINLTKALNYINQVRSRAGLTIPLTTTDLTFDRIVHERRVELVFEGHTLFDMKRWRLAHLVWNGNNLTVAQLKANIGQATKPNTQPFSLWPYLYQNPGNPNHGKWMFREIKLSRVTGANTFQLGNYYSEINNNILSRNPKIVKQPNQ